MEIKEPNRATRRFTQKLIAGFTEEFYEHFMRGWETRMNHYLETGEALRAA